MENEQVEVVEQEQQVNEYQKYLDSINQLKSNTVSKDKYDKLAEENKTLLESIVNGQKLAAAETDNAPKYTKEDLIKQMIRPEIKANDFVEAALKYRDLVIEETGKDPFVAYGHMVQPSQEAYDSAERAATVFKECLDNSDGDCTLFVQGLQNRTNDVRLPGIK